MTRIGIIGAGSAMKDFLSLLPSNVKGAGIGDNNKKNRGSVVEGYSVSSVEDIVEMNLDFYIIAARSVEDVRKQLCGLGVDRKKVCAYYPSYSQELTQVINRDISALNDALSVNLPAAGIATMYLWPEPEGRPRASAGEDFVRRQACRLCAAQIKDRNVPGAIAELGVYQGEHAALLGALFPDRPLHLFDTFEGFSERDLGMEASAGFSRAALGDFQDTSVELVLRRIEGAERVHVHKGFFPETAEGVEDRFAFVSLDVDLYGPTLAGLDWFYPRLETGGYIFVHDYNNLRYKGVGKAVDEFLSRSGACAMPIPDFAGSMVVLK